MSFRQRRFLSFNNFIKQIKHIIHFIMNSLIIKSQIFYFLFRIGKLSRSYLFILKSFLYPPFCRFNIRRSLYIIFLNFSHFFNQIKIYIQMILHIRFFHKKHHLILYFFNQSSKSFYKLILSKKYLIVKLSFILSYFYL